MKENKSLGTYIRDRVNSFSKKLLFSLVPQEKVDNPENEFILGETTKQDENGNLVAEKVIKK